jgi:hypothetical protein
LVSPKPDTPKTFTTPQPGSSGFKSIYTWGVRDRAGEWVEITDSQWFAPHTAKHITRTEALRVFEKYPHAFQLIDGCDRWACLSDEDEVFIVVKEKTDVATPEAVSGTPSD